MISWQDLDAQFSRLNDPRGFTRLDIQWGVAGEHLSISGYFDAATKQRFDALAKLAGEKLMSCLEPGNEINDFILSSSNPETAWYRALWKCSPAFKFGVYGIQQSESGEDMGHIYSGTVPCVYANSATLALSFLSQLGERTNTVEEPNHSFSEKVASSLSLKPGIFGVSIDLKKLFKRTTRRDI